MVEHPSRGTMEKDATAFSHRRSSLAAPAAFALLRLISLTN
jgi:hypothetical protein